MEYKLSHHKHQMINLQLKKVGCGVGLHIQSSKDQDCKSRPTGFIRK